MKNLILSALALILATSGVFAQINEDAQTPSEGVANSTEEQDVLSALELFRADFRPQPSGILHIYVDPAIDPAGVYLFKGKEASSTTKSLLPAKFQAKIKEDSAKVYATRAIKVMGTDDHYLVRFNGLTENHIELFTINDNKLEHVMTVAVRNCNKGVCKQLDTWITDIDGDTDSELIVIERIIQNGEANFKREHVYKYDNDILKWKRSKILAQDAPWSTIEFFDPSDKEEIEDDNK